MTVEVDVTPEPDAAPVDSGDTIVVTGDGGDDETARAVGRLEAENAQMRAELDELRAQVAGAQVTADVALDVAADAAETAEVAEEVAEVAAEPEPEPEPEPERDEPPVGKHPFHKSLSELRGR